MNLGDLIREGLESSRRPEDGLLHCSTDLLGSLRHAQLRIAGAPQEPEPTAQKIRMMTGTLWHQYIGKLLEQKGVPVMREVNVTAGLPEGWGGTLDLLSFNTDVQRHQVRDVKTQKAEAFAYHTGVREDHLWQLSAYNAGLRNMGYPMMDEMEVVYVPMNAVAGHHVEIQEETCTILPVADLWEEMEDKRAQLQAYLALQGETGVLLNDLLAPVPEREQAIRKGKTKTGGAYDLVLVPSWRAAYCRFAPPLCECSLQGQTKIGTFVEVGTNTYMYEPREGYEQIEPVVTPEGMEVISV